MFLRLKDLREVSDSIKSPHIQTSDVDGDLHWLNLSLILLFVFSGFISIKLKRLRKHLLVIAFVTFGGS